MLLLVTWTFRLKPKSNDRFLLESSQEKQNLVLFCYKAALKILHVRIIRIGKDLLGNLAQTPAHHHHAHKTTSLSATPTQFLNASRDCDSATSQSTSQVSISIHKCSPSHCTSLDSRLLSSSYPLDPLQQQGFDSWINSVCSRAQFTLTTIQNSTEYTFSEVMK